MGNGGRVELKSELRPIVGVAFGYSRGSARENERTDEILRSWHDCVQCVGGGAT